eukprot:281730-Rhodomonas_salina.1
MTTTPETDPNQQRTDHRQPGCRKVTTQQLSSGSEENAFPDVNVGFAGGSCTSPVQSARKFSTVLGHVLPYSATWAPHSTAHALRISQAPQPASDSCEGAARQAWRERFRDGGLRGCGGWGQ